MGLRMKNTLTVLGIIALAAVIAFSMAGCDNSEDGGGGFVPVDSITGVPTAGTAEIPLTLTATVHPPNATNKAIEWFPLTTGASISGNILTAAAAGIVTVRASIANGKDQGIHYSQDFEIAINDRFIPVNSITGVPGMSIAGIPHAFTGTVNPPNATNKTIVWSLINAGTTGASLSGNILKTSAAGTVTVKAAIADGTEQGDYTQEFNITVSGSGSPIPGTTLAEKLLWLKDNAQNASYTIEVDSDESIDPQTLSYDGIDAIIIQLKGNGGEQAVSLSQNGSLFTIEPGVTLILDSNITLQGNGGNNAPLVNVQSNGALIMNAGAKISDNTASAYYSISSISYESHGGGVRVDGNGTFIMTGGEISGNTAYAYYSYSASTYAYGGGVYVGKNGVFSMTGGKISGNAARSFSNNGSLSHGGGVYADGMFTMTDGEISGNTAVTSLTGSASARSIFRSSGGGVYVDTNGTFMMTRGKVSGNTADSFYYSTSNSSFSSHGGGVCVDTNGAFTMEDGEVSGNTASSSSPYASASVGYGSSAASYGGGVHGSLTMNGGIISGNTVTSNDASSKPNPNANSYRASGGGVYGNLTMTGGTISGNTVTSSTAGNFSSGGGVHSGAFRIVSGTIYGSIGDANLINIAVSGAALYANRTAQYGTAQYGTFSIPGDITSAWISAGDLETTSDMIRVENGAPY